MSLIIKITKQMLRDFGACERGYKWFLGHNLHDKNLTYIIKHLIDDNYNIVHKCHDYEKRQVHSGYIWIDWLLVNIHNSLHPDYPEHLGVLSRISLEYTATHPISKVYDDKEDIMKDIVGWTQRIKKNIMEKESVR